MVCSIYRSFTTKEERENAMKRMIGQWCVVSMLLASVIAAADDNVKIGFLVVSTDVKLNKDTLNDLTETITFSIASKYTLFGSITKERIASALKFSRNQNQSTCFSDLLCVRQRASDLKKEIAIKDVSLTAVELIVIELLVEENHIRVIARFGSSDLSAQGFETKSAYLVKREFKELSSAIHAVTELVLLRTHPKSIAGSPKKEIVEKEKEKKVGILHKETPPVQKEVIPEIKTDAVPTETNSKKILFRVLAGVAGTVGMSTAIVAGIAAKNWADAQDEIDRCANEYCANFAGTVRQNVIEVGRSKALAVNILAPTAAVMTGLAIAFWFIGDRYDEVPIITVAPATDSGSGMQMLYQTHF